MSETHDDYDSPWKNVIEWYFSDFMAFLFPTAFADIDWGRPVEFLDKELQQVVRDAEFGRRYADKLAKVWRKDGTEQWVLAHLEVQGDPDEQFERRMYTYNYRLFDRYGHYVASFAVLADTNNEWRPGHFGYELWECEVSFKFPVVKLLDYANQWEALAASDNPFATIVMAHCKTQETKHNPELRRYWKFSLIRRLYERGYARQDVLNLFHFIDWLMQLPEPLEERFWQELWELEAAKKMTYVTSVERYAEKRGLAKGLEQGREEGREEGLEKGLEAVVRLLIRLLEYRFGQIPEEMIVRLRKLSFEQAEMLVDTTLTADNLEELLAHLPKQSTETEPSPVAEESTEKREGS